MFRAHFAADWDALGPWASLALPRGDRPSVALPLGRGQSFAVHPSSGADPWTVSAPAREVLDHDCVYRTMLGGQIAIQGARGVRQEWLSTYVPTPTPNLTVTTAGRGVHGNDLGDWMQIDHSGGPGETVEVAAAMHASDAGSYYVASLYARLTPGETYDGSTDGLAVVLGGGIAKQLDFGAQLAPEWRRFSSDLEVADGADLTFTIKAGGASNTAPWSIQVKGYQLEAAVGGAETACCGDYIRAPSARATVYFDRANGNARNASTNVVTESGGEPLHPTRVRDGIVVYDAYALWAASTAIAAGERRIPDYHAHGPAGGNGWYYVADVAGTTGATQPAWPTTPGATVVDGGVTWRCVGRYRIAGAVCQPSRTNSLIQSVDLTDPAWIGDAKITPAARIDPLGRGSAFTVEDTSATDRQELRQDVVVADDNAWHTISVFVLRSAEPVSVFPQLTFSLALGTLQQVQCRFDPHSGETFAFVAVGSYIVHVERVRDWWRLTISLQNDASGNTQARWIFIPAAATSLSGPRDDTLIGSQIIAYPQVEAGQYAMSPIRTAGAPVAVPAAVPEFPSHVTDDGRSVVDIALIPTWPNRSAVTNGRALDFRSGAHMLTDNAGRIALRIGGVNAQGRTTGATYPDRGTYRSAGRWQGGTHQMAVMGQGAGDAGSYTGPLGDGSPWILGYNSGAPIAACLRNFAKYDDDPGQATIEALSELDR